MSLQIIKSILDSNGFSAATSPEKADVVLLNTCSIREKAEAKIFSRLGVLRNDQALRSYKNTAGKNDRQVFHLY